MYSFDHSYYRAGKTVTRVIGLWPYQSLWESRICSFVIIFLCTSQFIAEVFGLVVYFDDKAVVLESVAPFIIDVGMAAKYVNTAVNINTMMELLDRLKKNWSIYSKAEEKRILDEYARFGQLIVQGYIVAVYVTVLVFVTEPLIPRWINFILQANETVPIKYPVPIYWYMVDMEAYFYSILCYESLCIFAILTITVANDSMFIIFLQHACALFTIVGHQFEKLPMKEEMEKDQNFGGKVAEVEDIQYEYYVMCIKNHKSAIEFANLLEDLYVWSFGVVIALNMPIMSITAVQIVTQTNTIQQIIKYSMFTCTQIMHLFFDCFLSQQLTDCSTAIQQHITYSQWYGLSSKTKRLVPLVTLRSQIPCILTAGKLVLLSMETFGVIIKTSVSYFTVMLSM